MIGPLKMLKCGPSLKFFILACFYISYLVIGAYIFSSIEGPLEKEIVYELRDNRIKFLGDHGCVSEEALENFILEVVAAGNRGVSASRNVSGQPNWSLGQSIFFSSTVLTTIGYGHVTPLSRAGKIFCMIYAAGGIPLTLVLLTALVERLLIPATAMLRSLNSALGHLYQPFTIRLLHLFIMMLLLLVFLILLPAWGFSVLEPEWDFLDSFYYCFISLTTIGLGDYIPGDSPNQPMRPLYKLLITVYLFVGLAFMMLCLTVFYDIPQLNVGVLFSSQNVDNDPEKMRLSEAGLVGPQYTVGSLALPGHFTPQTSAPARRSVVKIKPHRDDSPSPDDITPEHARQIRVP